MKKRQLTDETLAKLNRTARQSGSVTWQSMIRTAHRNRDSMKALAARIGISSNTIYHVCRTLDLKKRKTVSSESSIWSAARREYTIRMKRIQDSMPDTGRFVVSGDESPCRQCPRRNRDKTTCSVLCNALKLYAERICVSENQRTDPEDVQKIDPRF